MVETEFCTPEEKRDALEKALSSRTLARSEQLRSFLRFVCEAELRGDAHALTEYRIGVEVLHRSPAYSPAEDSSVRTRAYELRHKLERLYADELSGQPVQIVIPKGAYSPRFQRTSEAERKPSQFDEIESGPVRQLSVIAPKAASRGRLIWLALTLAAGFLGVVLGIMISQAQKPALDRIVAEAWNNLAKPNDTVLLVPATPLYLVLGPETHGAYGSPTFPAPRQAYPLFAQHRPLEAGQKLGMIFTNDALGVGSMNAVLLASQTLRAMGAASQILPERPAMMSFIHGRGAILFGAPVDSQLIAEVLEKTPLTVAYDEEVREFVVRDRRTGQRFVPEKLANGDFKFVYGLITVLNNRESDHGSLGTLVFSGVTSVGTHGAAEYFTSAQSLASLRGAFAREGIRGFPPAYQVVVKCSFENMLLVGSEYAAHRVLARE